MNYEHIQLVNSMIMPILVLYMFVFMLFYTRKYIRLYARGKVLRFTQEEVKERKKEILKIVELLVKSSVEKNIPWQKDLNRERAVYELFSIYNEFAVGINEGIYDEVYIRMVCGHEMIMYYKRYYNEIYSFSDDFQQEILFMPLELLLKKWDDNKSAYYFKNNRGR